MTIPGVVVYTPRRHADSRGCFVETFNERACREIGIDATFVQDNESYSARSGTIRGLHFQRPPMAQSKLVRVLRGRVLDVAVDLRAGLPTYAQWTSHMLTADGGEQMFVPRGFAHAFCTLEADTVVAYKVDNFYDASCEEGLKWDDPTLAIKWPISPELAVLSEKDQMFGRFADFVSPFRYEDRS